MNTKAYFPCGGGWNLILGTGTENQICFLRTLVAPIKFFHRILKKWHFGVKKKIITHPDGFVWLTYDPLHYSLWEL